MQKRSKYLNPGRCALIFAFVAAPVSGLLAQIKITGTVVDKMNEPVIGGSILVKGTTIGTITDIDGNYEIEVPKAGQTLVYSYIGMQSKEMSAKGGQMNVTLEETSQALDEVVVVGYGTQKKRDLTGSVASVNSEALKDVPVASAAEAISGRLAGVQVTSTEGSPDAEVKIRVRGGGSITGDNTPLYIVDGFPVSSISDIPPGDIQSIDVLKDASSTAIYGSQGANGVIIVTTKTPKDGSKFSLNYNGSFGVRKIAKTLDVMDPYEFVKWQAESNIINNNTTYDKRFDGVQEGYTKYFGGLDNLESYRGVEGNDHQNEIFGRTGYMSNNNISITGGSENVSYNASYARTDDKAIMLDSKYTRNNLAFKLNAKPYKFLKLNFSTRYTDTQVEGAGATETNEKSSSDSRLKNAVIYTPISLKLTESENDDDEDAAGGLIDPVLSIKDNYRFQHKKNFSINGGASLDLMKGLTLRSELGIETNRSDDNRYYGTSTYYSQNAASIKNAPAVIITDTDINRFRNSNTLNWNKKFNKSHNLGVLVGQELTTYEKSVKTTLVEGLSEGFSPEESFNMTPDGKFSTTDNRHFRDKNILSFFGRVNYDYKGKYLLTGTMRADGSSMFAAGNRWGYFPSVAGAWRISDEGFMAEAAETWLSNLKLRLSFGTAGNDRVSSDYYQAWESKSTSYVNDELSYWTPGNALYNPDIKWETTFTRNLGLDFGFFNNRLSGAVELYWNSTKDLLINMPLYGTGYEYQTQNIGSTSNKGVEVQLNGVIVDKKKFGLDVGFNVGMNKSRVDDLGGLDEMTANSGWNSRISDDYKVYVGQPVGLMYGYVTDGFYTTDDFLFDTNGDAILDKNGKWQLKDGGVDNSSITGNAWGPGALKLKDLDGDGKITSADRTVIGNSNPKFQGGFNINMRYGNFDLSSNFTFVIGNDIYNANKIEFTSNDTNRYYRNMLNSMRSENRYSRVDMSTGEVIYNANQLNSMNANATMWSPNYQFIVHSWAIEDGSFLRLNNLTLGYTLPKSLVHKAKLSNVRVYATGTNLFCLTKYSGYDPEVDSRRKTPLTPGVDYSAYPKSRSFSVGVNLTL